MTTCTNTKPRVRLPESHYRQQSQKQKKKKQKLPSVTKRCPVCYIVSKLHSTTVEELGCGWSYSVRGEVDTLERHERETQTRMQVGTVFLFVCFFDTVSMAFRRSSRELTAKTDRALVGRREVGWRRSRPESAVSPVTLKEAVLLGVNSRRDVTAVIVTAHCRAFVGYGTEVVV